MVRGDFIHDLGTKQRIVFESEDPVTGVQLAVDEKLMTTLFVSTTSRILKVGLSRKGQGQPPKTVEDVGCDWGCMTLDKRTGDIVVAREDAIYTYNLDGRGPPKAYESPKKSITTFQEYVALSCPPSANGRDPDSVRRRFGGASDALFNASTFAVLEMDLRIVAHTETVISPVRYVFEIWGDLYTMAEDGKVRILSNDGNRYTHLSRFTDTTKSLCSRGLKCSTRGTCSPWLLSWLRNLVLGQRSRA